MKHTNNDLKYYLNLPYAIVLIPDEDGSWLAKLPDLPGCITVGDTRMEALELLDDAKLTWISGRLQAGDSIPEPEMTF